MKEKLCFESTTHHEAVIKISSAIWFFTFRQLKSGALSFFGCISNRFRGLDSAANAKVTKCCL